MHSNDGWLQFDVRGPIFKGRIIILLMPTDTYTIIGGTIRGTTWKIVHTKTDVYAEDLVSVIDKIVG